MQDILAVLREAIATRRCVVIMYKGEARTLEAYGLHTSQDGSMLLHARKYDTGQVRTYRIDRIESAVRTDVPFAPMNQVHTGTGKPVETGYHFS